MIVKNAKSRLMHEMQQQLSSNWSPTANELHVFSILTTVLFLYDPIGIQTALDYDFSYEDIYDEYDLEAATLLRCKALWPDASCLGYAIKEVIDHFFANDYPWEDCFYLAYQAMPSIEDENIELNLDAIRNYTAHRKHDWLPIEVE